MSKTEADNKTNNTTIIKLSDGEAEARRAVAFYNLKAVYAVSKKEKIPSSARFEMVRVQLRPLLKDWGKIFWDASVRNTSIILPVCAALIVGIWLFSATFSRLYMTVPMAMVIVMMAVDGYEYLAKAKLIRGMAEKSNDPQNNIIVSQLNIGFDTYVAKAIADSVMYLLFFAIGLSL